MAESLITAKADLCRPCKSCGQSKPFSDYRKDIRGRDGLRASCVECERAKAAVYRANKDRSSEYARRGEQLKAQREALRDPEDEARKLRERRRRKVCRRVEAVRRRAKAAARREAERAMKPWLAPGLTRAERQSLRRKHDVNTILRNRARCRLRRKGIKGSALKAIRQALTAKRGNSRRQPMEAMLGYAIDDLRVHLERQFTKGMNWEAFKTGAIHIDHIRPLCTFDLSNADDAGAAWCLSNLRPLWASDNMARPRDGSDILL